MVPTTSGYAPYPTVDPGEPPKSTLGGMNYAISTYSKHPDEAFEAAMCMRNEKHQLSARASTPATCRRWRRVFDEPEFSRRTR